MIPLVAIVRRHVGLAALTPRVLPHPAGHGAGDGLAGRQHRRVEEGLEGRTRLAAGLDGAVEGRRLEVAAADHGPDAAGGRVQGHQGHLGLGDAVVLAQGGHQLVQARHRRLRRLLHVQVQGGVDAKASGVKLIGQLGDLVGQAVPHEVDEVGGAGVGLVGRAQAQRLRLGPFGLGGADHAQLGHPREDPVPAALGALGVAPVDLGAADEGRQGRRFGQGQLVQGLAEVLPGRHLRPVGAPAEVDLVEVHRQDLILRVVGLQLDGQQGLPELAAEGALQGQVVEGAGQLLGDGRTPLHDAAGLQVAQGRPADGDGIEAVVPVEAGVLGGHHRLPQAARDLVGPGQLAVLPVEAGDDPPLDVVDHRGLGDLGLGQGGDGGVGHDPGPRQGQEDHGRAGPAGHPPGPGGAPAARTAAGPARSAHPAGPVAAAPRLRGRPGPAAPAGAPFHRCFGPAVARPAVPVPPVVPAAVPGRHGQPSRP